jgi:hypothetical protein
MPRPESLDSDSLALPWGSRQAALSIFPRNPRQAAPSAEPWSLPWACADAMRTNHTCGQPWTPMPMPDVACARAGWRLRWGPELSEHALSHRQNTHLAPVPAAAVSRWFRAVVPSGAAPDVSRSIRTVAPSGPAPNASRARYPDLCSRCPVVGTSLMRGTCSGGPHLVMLTLLRCSRG